MEKDIVATTDTDGGIGEEVEIIDFELAEDGEVNENND